MGPAPYDVVVAPRIGFVSAGDSREPTTWSGTPKGLAQGLEQIGVELVRLQAAPTAVISGLALRAVAAARVRPPLDGGLLRAVRRNRDVAIASREMAALRSRALAHKLGNAPRLDGLVQIGTEYRIDSALPFVTFEDRTVPQAARSPYSFAHRLPADVLADWHARQRWAYERAVACCMTSSWGAESVVRDFGIAAEKVHSVGVGRNHSPPPVEREWTTPKFLFVGMEWERKNGPRVLRVFVRLRERLPEARLDVVGRHPRIDQDGVTAHGVMRLDVPDERRTVERLFQQATCFVMPSFQEPSALAFVEAAAAGLPSIGTTEGGSGDLIGDAGRVVDPADDEALLAAMTELSDPGTARELGALGARRSNLFTWRKVAERTLRALAPPGVELERLAPFL